MITYKLLRVKNGKLYPLYVEANKEMPVGKWLKAGCGELKDKTHVKARGCGGRLSLRPGYHSTRIPYASWIGKKMTDGTLAQRPDTVWCECEVRGKKLNVTEKNGLRTIPNGYYLFRTNSKQIDPWIISREIKINRVLSQEEVKEICNANGIEPQPIAV